MTGNEFLKKKDLIKENFNEFVITFSDREPLNLGETLDEFAQADAIEFASWCYYCIDNTKDMNQNYKRFKESQQRENP